MSVLQRTAAVLVASMSTMFLCAQDTVTSDTLDRLQQQVRELQQTIEKERQLRQQQLDALQQQIIALQQKQIKETKDISGSSTNVSLADTNTARTPENKKTWSPTTPITLLGSQKNYLNISLDGLIAAGASSAGSQNIEQLNIGGHDPKQNGFTIQNLEMVLDGAVDPYFRAQANLIYQIDTDGESNFEVEEAYAETTSLPLNLQLKAGQYLTEFGRINVMHPHAWLFVNQPLVNGRIFGGDGLRGQGARLSWLIPTPFYSELFLGVQNGQGETAYSFRNSHPGEMLFGRPGLQRGVDSLGDLLFTPRYAMSFDLTDSQTILWGTSAAFGPNASGAENATQIYGTDLYWKWKPTRHHGGFPFVSWQTEALWRRYSAGSYDGSDPLQPLPLPSEILDDYGFYSQLAWGFKKGWVLGFRGDWVQGDKRTFYPDPDRDQRWRLSPNLTYYPTEYSKIRLQYDNDHRKNIGVDHSVWLQLEFILGAHAAHKF